MNAVAPMKVDAWIGLGANLGDPPATLARAREAIGALAGTRITGESSLYRSAPIQAQGPDFVNQVLRVSTGLAARPLLDALQAIEAAHGRARPYPNAPRTLDLDLLLHGLTESGDPALALPHPRLHLRAFVLLPMLEIAPALCIPGLGAAAAFVPGCADQRCERLTPTGQRA